MNTLQYDIPDFARIETIKGAGLLLLEDFAYEWTITGKAIRNAYPFRHKYTQRITVPEGFVFDGASVPRIAMWAVRTDKPSLFDLDKRDKATLMLVPSLLHDWGYAIRGRLVGPYSLYVESKTDAAFQGGRNLNITLEKHFWDLLFGRVMREYGIGSIERKLAYTAVDLFGGKAWKS